MRPNHMNTQEKPPFVGTCSGLITILSANAFRDLIKLKMGIRSLQVTTSLQAITVPSSDDANILSKQVRAFLVSARWLVSKPRGLAKGTASRGQFFKPYWPVLRLGSHKLPRNGRSETASQRKDASASPWRAAMVGSTPRGFTMGPLSRGSLVVNLFRCVTTFEICPA